MALTNYATLATVLHPKDWALLVRHPGWSLRVARRPDHPALWSVTLVDPRGHSHTEQVCVPRPPA